VIGWCRYARRRPRTNIKATKMIAAMTMSQT
jgi:hypothetical protein